jgi:hypothetical protein
MGDELDFDAAMRLARQLKAIPNFPWDEDVVIAHAYHLMRWCKGTILNGRVWPAERQAEWLVTEVQETWIEKWLGTGALLQVFRGKFHTAAVPGNGYRPPKESEKTPPACASCNDFGTVKTAQGDHVYCNCDQGLSMIADPGMGDRWIALLNRETPARRRSSLASELGLPSLEERGAQFGEYQQTAQARIAEAEAVLADENAPRERKELAAALLQTFRPEAKRKRERGDAS